MVQLNTDPALAGKPKRPEIDEAEFGRIRKAHFFRCLALILTMIPIVILAFREAGVWIGIVLIIIAAPLIYQLWSGVFKAARLYGSPLFDRYKVERKRRQFMEKREAEKTGAPKSEPDPSADSNQNS